MTPGQGEAVDERGGAEAAESGEIVQAFARGLAVIRAFDAQNRSLTLSDVARRADVTRAAAGRFLRTLESLGYVRSDGRLHTLTPRVLELGFSYLSASTLPEVAQPHLEALSRATDESASVAVLEGAEIVYVARVPLRRIMSVGIMVGTRFPAAVTSMGRVLLAHADPAVVDRVLDAPLTAFTPQTLTDPARVRDELALIRERGWAVVDGELEPGLKSVAVPVRGREGAVTAAVNVSMSSGRYPDDVVVGRFVPEMQRTAAAIEADSRLL